MAVSSHIEDDWVGRLVRVLVVFRSFILLVTVILIPARQHTPAVGLVVLVAASVSYLPLRYWPRIQPTVSRHPLYLAVEVLLTTVILAAAGARSPFFYFTLGTAVLAGIVYGRRGAIPFSALLMAAYELVALQGFPNLRPLHDATSVAFVPLLYPAALAAGVAAREVVARGAQTDALLRGRTEALASERERLRVARELHDSLAKTVEGLAMTASVLPGRCLRDPAAAAKLAEGLVSDARQAALEARSLMSDLRPEPESELPFAEIVRKRVQSLSQRSGATARVVCDSERAGEALTTHARHELLRILGEAIRNAVGHGGASTVIVALETVAGEAGHAGLVLTVSDDGCGIKAPIELDRLKADGHFGLVGMHERASAIGGVLRVQSESGAGTTVSVRVTVASAGPGTGGADRHDEAHAAAAVGAGRRWRRRSRSDSPEVRA